MNVTVDAKEQTRIPLAIKKWNAKVEDLPVGDYLFNNQVVFEYKTLNDFCKSIKDNRIFNQSLNQRLKYPYHFIIIELRNFQCTNKDWDHLYYQYNISTTQFRHAIARLNTYTTVLLIPGNINECFQWMETQATKCLNEKILHKHPNIKTANTAMNFLCNDIRGIGPAKAETITQTLNLKTLEDLLNLTLKDLTSIEGIGIKTAKLILGEIFKKEE